MRIRHAVIALAILPAAGFGQSGFAPVPSDPLELANAPAQPADTVVNHQATVALLRQAATNFAFHARGGAPYAIKMSFTASGPWTIQGSGELTEAWLSGQQWQWTAAAGGYSQLRIFSGGVAYDRPPGVYLPMPVYMVRGAIFNPVYITGERMKIRTVSANWKGTPVTCALLSGVKNPPAGSGRLWQESEYCVDPNSGLLQTFSAAPGIYVAYDYSNAIKFHGRTVPGKITISESGNTVIEAQITSLADLDPNAAGGLFTPSPDMTAGGPGVIATVPERFPLRAHNASASEGIQPVIVHVSIDNAGTVREAEALQSTTLSAAAVELVRKNKYPVRTAPESVPHEREAFINVQFVP